MQKRKPRGMFAEDPVYGEALWGMSMPLYPRKQQQESGETRPSGYSQ